LLIETQLPQETAVVVNTGRWAKYRLEAEVSVL